MSTFNSPRSLPRRCGARRFLSRAWPSDAEKQITTRLQNSVSSPKLSASSSRGRLFPVNVFESGRFATEIAQVIKLRSTDFRRAHHLDLIDHAGAIGENALYALAEADLADREARLRAP